MGWLGLVGITGVFGVPRLGDVGIPAEGVVPVPLGAVVAPGAVGLETPAPEAPVPVPAPPTWAQTGKAAAVSKQIKPVIFLINYRRS
jgi:hypothetical protein